MVASILIRPLLQQWRRDKLWPRLLLFDFFSACGYDVMEVVHCNDAAPIVAPYRRRHAALAWSSYSIIIVFL